MSLPGNGRPWRDPEQRARGLMAEPAKPSKKGDVPTHPVCDTAVAPHRLQKAGNSQHPLALFVQVPDQDCPGSFCTLLMSGGLKIPQSAANVLALLLLPTKASADLALLQRAGAGVYLQEGRWGDKRLSLIGSQALAGQQWLALPGWLGPVPPAWGVTAAYSSGYFCGVAPALVFFLGTSGFFESHPPGSAVRVLCLREELSQ